MKKSLLLGVAAALTLAGAALAAPGDQPRRADANADGRVTLAEQQAALRARFARLDANKDGRVTKAEAEAERGQRLGRRGGRDGAALDPAARAQRVEQRFARLDTDRNGQISKAEFAAGAEKMGGRGHRGGHGMRGHGRGGPGGRGDLFARFDANKDGAVTNAELDQAVAARFARVDANRDGVISADERKAAWEARKAERQRAR